MKIPANTLTRFPVRAVLVTALAGFCWGCTSEKPQSPPAVEPDVPAKSAPKPPTGGGLLDDLEPAENSVDAIVSDCRVRFNDVHEEAGLRFTYDNGASPKKLMPESTSGGAAWLDYDADGLWDLFCGQGGRLDTAEWADQPVDELYRQRPAGAFESVTERAQLEDRGFGHGVAAGDFDNDGFDDVFIAGVHHNQLLKNMGDGTFLDVSDAIAVPGRRWSSTAAWADVDRDGDLDLYVATYVDYDPLHPIECLDDQGNPSTCNPTAVEGVPDLFFVNEGDGTFRECAAERGLVGPGSKSLGVVIADLSGDSIPDIYVANDTEANHYFVNDGTSRFQDQAVAMGCALSGLGQAQASMGIGFGDYDRNGWPDLYLTHFTDDSNTLYQNLGDSGFVDVTRELGLHLPTLPYLAFGTVMADFDSNGWQDLFVANGHIDDWRKRTGSMWKMPPQFFVFDGRQWQECTKSAGPYFERELLGRAVASADYDGDGDLDLAVTHQNDPMALLRNDSESGHWLQARFIGTESNRRGIGVKMVVRQGDLELVQELPGGTSYACSHQPLLQFGLGASDAPCDVTVTWPSGRRQELKQVPVDQRLVFREDEARAGTE